MGETGRIMKTSIAKIPLYILSGWLVPGLGHLIYGKKFKGFMFLALISMLVMVGVSFDGEIYSPRIWAENQEHTLGPYLPLTANFFTGSYFITAYLTTFADGDIKSKSFEIGNTFILTAGFLNLLILVDLFDYMIGYRKKDEQEVNESEDEVNEKDEKVKE